MRDLEKRISKLEPVASENRFGVILFWADGVQCGDDVLLRCEGESKESLFSRAREAWPHAGIFFPVKEGRHATQPAKREDKQAPHDGRSP